MKRDSGCKTNKQQARRTLVGTELLAPRQSAMARLSKCRQWWPFRTTLRSPTAAPDDIHECFIEDGSNRVDGMDTSFRPDECSEEDWLPMLLFICVTQPMAEGSACRAGQFIVAGRSSFTVMEDPAVGAANEAKFIAFKSCLRQLSPAASAVLHTQLGRAPDMYWQYDEDCGDLPQRSH